MQPIIEKTFASFVAPGDDYFRLLDAAEVAQISERIDVEQLAAKGIHFSPFDPRPLRQRERYIVAEIPEEAWTTDPFEIIDRQQVVERDHVEEETTVEWSGADRIAASKYEQLRTREQFLANLSGVQRVHENRSPFYIKGAA